MKYCKKCSALFKNNQTQCPYCNRSLTEDIAPESWASMALATGFELERIEAALKTADIPYTLKSPKKQMSMRALNSAPMENYNVLVPVFAYDDAYELLAGINALDFDKVTEPDKEMLKEIETARQKHNNDIDEMSPRKRRLVKIFSALAFIIILALVVFATDTVMAWVKQLFGM
ncbi:MAG: hypothetical protein ACI4M3_08535 [Acutalibacteraceae bacterium]